MNSNQSAFIFGYLFIAFFVWITLRGELPTYMGLLLLSPAGSASTSTTPQQQSQAGSTNAQNTASQQAATFLGTALKAFVLGGA